MIIFVQPLTDRVLLLDCSNGDRRRCSSPFCGHENPVWVGAKYMSLLGLCDGILGRGHDSFRRQE